MANWQQGAQGAAGGAAAGGSLGGPYGAAAGGLVGGALGLFGGGQPSLPGYGARNAHLQAAIAGADDRAGAQVGKFKHAGNGGVFRTGQARLIAQLQQQAAGKGPSLAGLQARQAADMGMAQQLSMAASAAPGNQALAARQAMQGNAGITAQLAQTAAQARMAEQMSARQQLAGTLQGARGQELQHEQFNAGQYNSRQLAQGQLDDSRLGRNTQAEMRLRELEMQNAQARAGMSQPNTMGTQIMSGGANLLAMYGTGAFRKKEDPTMAGAFNDDGSFRYA